MPSQPSQSPSAITNSPTTSYPTSPTISTTTTTWTRNEQPPTIWTATVRDEFVGYTFYCPNGTDCYINCITRGACQNAIMYAPVNYSLIVNCSSSSPGGNRYYSACYSIKIYAENSYFLSIASYSEADLWNANIYVPSSPDIDLAAVIYCHVPGSSCYGIGGNNIYSRYGFEKVWIYDNEATSNAFIMNCGYNYQSKCVNFTESSSCDWANNGPTTSQCPIDCKSDANKCWGNLEALRVSSVSESVAEEGGSTLTTVLIVIGILCILSTVIFLIISKYMGYCCFRNNNDKEKDGSSTAQQQTNAELNALQSIESNDQDKQLSDKMDGTPGLDKPMEYKEEPASAPHIDDDHEEMKEEVVDTTNGAEFEYKNIAPSAPNNNDNEDDMIEMPAEPGKEQDQVEEPNTNDLNKDGENEGLNMKEEEKERIKQWFHDEVQLFDDNEKYFDLFIQNGFDKISTIQRIQKSDLEEIGIDKLGHRNAILYAIDKL